VRGGSIESTAAAAATSRIANPSGTPKQRNKKADGPPVQCRCVDEM
jgi:hypothetical protein